MTSIRGIKKTIQLYTSVRFLVLGYLPIMFYKMYIFWVIERLINKI